MDHGLLGSRAVLPVAIAALVCGACAEPLPRARPEPTLTVAPLGQIFQFEQKLLLEPVEIGYQLGSAVATDGRTAIVGAPRFPIDPPGLVGAAYAFNRDAKERWSPAKRLVPSNGTLQHGLGEATAIMDDLAIVGAPFGRDEDAGIPVAAGAAHVFRRSGDQWVELPAVLQDMPVPGDYFGAQLAADGDTLLVGAPGDDERAQDGGSVYVLRWTGSEVAWEDKLLHDDPTRVGFGYAFAIDGDRALVSQLDTDSQGRNATPGRIYAFERKSSVWKMTQQFEADDAVAEDGFGSSISIDGDLALIGAEGRDDLPVCEEYDLRTGQPCDSGGAYLFAHRNGQWMQTQRLEVDDLSEVDNYGAEVLLQGDYALVSAPNGTVGVLGVGVVYVFVRDADGAWSLLQKLEPDADQPGEDFGTSLAMHDGILLVGAPNDGQAGLQAGSVYVYSLRDAPPQRVVQSGIDGGLYADVLGPDGTHMPATRADVADMDAGTATGDAGSPSDAAGGCGCSAVGAGRRSRGCLGVALLALGYTLMRRPARRLGSTG